MIANVDAAFAFVMIAVMIVVMIMIMIVIVIVRAIGHAVMAIPALVARAVPLLFDHAAGHHTQVHACDQELHCVTLPRGFLRQRVPGTQ